LLENAREEPNGQRRQRDVEELENAEKEEDSQEKQENASEEENVQEDSDGSRNQRDVSRENVTRVFLEDTHLHSEQFARENFWLNPHQKTWQEHYGEFTLEFWERKQDKPSPRRHGEFSEQQRESTEDLLQDWIRTCWELALWNATVKTLWQNKILMHGKLEHQENVKKDVFK